ncbi:MULTISPECIES: phosphate ABC transporter permease subunit PstC [Kordiimonas]|jgi:phosphate transport system permease protein|uniref:Phosphate transport system permease protein n=1 Tax=Kordiimonas lacus TaxID=637679 RepID=A0A1G6W2S9_9PROT|nr:MULTISPECIES: phosphate ABC transporter permease subunit PstC [Kordiimonas]SDD60098.1 phosphate ABC transporter membrane protein 1, PhoT family (TC 3.A.1.7.1) [Kordiimonas lacus]
MTSSAIFLFLVMLALGSFVFARQKALAGAGGDPAKLHSLPRHYGYFAATCVLLPGLFAFGIWVIFGNSIIEGLILSGVPDRVFEQNGDQATLVLNRIRLAVENPNSPETDPDILAAAAKFQAIYLKGIWAAFVLSISLGLVGLYVAVNRTKPDFRARNKFERVVLITLGMSSVIAIATTLGIVASLLFESLRFFQEVSIAEFVFGLHWSPQTALRADQVASAGAFGAVPLFAGTLLISFIAMLVAGPIGLLAAIYLTQYASQRMRKIAKPMLEVLAGVPTVVYGFFAALTVAPLFRDMGITLGLDIASESALAAGIVMGIMIIPFVSSLSDDAITAVPKSLKDGSLALGATPSETIKQVVLPAALPGIVGAFLLAISRAVGETMIVVMAAGMQPNLTANPFEAVTTVTVQIVALLTGDQEFDSAKTLSAFALGLALFVSTMVLNVIALKIVRKYREVYD